MEPSAASAGTSAECGPGNNDDAASRMAANDPDIQSIVASHRQAALSILKCDDFAAEMEKLREKSLWALKTSMRAYDVSVLQGLLGDAEEDAMTLQRIAIEHYNEALTMLRSNAAALAAMRAQNLSKMAAAASLLPCTTHQPQELLARSEEGAVSFFRREQSAAQEGMLGGGEDDDIQQLLGRDASGVEEWLQNALSPKPHEQVSSTGSYGYEVGKTVEAEGPPANPIVPYATPSGWWYLPNGQYIPVFPYEAHAVCPPGSVPLGSPGNEDCAVPATVSNEAEPRHSPHIPSGGGPQFHKGARSIHSEPIILRKNFTWRDYPELEEYLIANRSGFLHHSALNYTSEQKNFNNQLTEGMLELAAKLNYVFDETCFNFKAVRDRIRCYYKSIVQYSKKREKKATKQARQVGMEGGAAGGHDTQMAGLADAAVEVEVDQPTTAKDVNEASLASSMHVFQAARPAGSGSLVESQPNQYESHRPRIQFRENAEYEPNSERETYLLCMPADGDILSSRQCFVRSHLVEVFIASEEDARARHSAGAHKIHAGQVGLRCAYCACLKRKHQRAVCYPSSISRLYESIADMQRSHFELCVAIPPKVKGIYKSLKSTRPRAAENPQSYWVKSAKEIGLIDTSDRGIQVDADGGMVMLEMQRKSTVTGQLGILGVEGQTVPGRVIQGTQMKVMDQPMTAEDMNEVNLASGMHVSQPSQPSPPFIVGTASALLELQSTACKTSTDPPVVQGCLAPSLSEDNLSPRSTTSTDAGTTPVIAGTTVASQMKAMTNGGAKNTVKEFTGLARCRQSGHERAILSWFDSTHEFGAPVVHQPTQRQSKDLGLHQFRKGGRSIHSEPIVLRKNFTWRDYPELEQYLIANRSDFLHHSALNYTSKQKNFNNRLTEGMLELAAKLNYVFDETCFNFKAVRDRIRCYYKSIVKTSKKQQTKRNAKDGLAESTTAKKAKTQVMTVAEM